MQQILIATTILPISLNNFQVFLLLIWFARTGQMWPVYWLRREDHRVSSIVLKRLIHYQWKRKRITVSGVVPNVINHFWRNDWTNFLVKEKMSFALLTCWHRVHTHTILVHSNVCVCEWCYTNERGLWGVKRANHRFAPLHGTLFSCFIRVNLVSIFYNSIA